MNVFGVSLAFKLDNFQTKGDGSEEWQFIFAF